MKIITEKLAKSTVLLDNVGPKKSKELSEFHQKTVRYKNVPENSHKCVRILSENCQMLISVRTPSENIWKFIRILSDSINVWKNCRYFIWKTVWNLSEISLQRPMSLNPSSRNSPQIRIQGTHILWELRFPKKIQFFKNLNSRTVKNRICENTWPTA